MQILEIKRAFSICKVEDFSQVDLKSDFCFIGKTDEEFSLVCETARMPANTMERDDGWRAFRIQGVMDFSLIGILSKISAILTEKKIGIFVVSTYNTDYVLTKEENFPHAMTALEQAGYEIVRVARS